MSSPDPEAPSDAPVADDPAPKTPTDAIRKALKAYRILAWATGIWLIALCYEMVLKYIVKVEDPPSWIGVVHGWVYTLRDGRVHDLGLNVAAADQLEPQYAAALERIRSDREDR